MLPSWRRRPQPVGHVNDFVCGLYSVRLWVMSTAALAHDGGAAPAAARDPAPPRAAGYPPRDVAPRCAARAGLAVLGEGEPGPDGGAAAPVRQRAPGGLSLGVAPGA